MADYDVLIIGSGPGGYVAAIRAAQLGLRTGVVERAHLGGVCSNWGCIPTKALLRSAEILRLVRGAGEFGVTLEGEARPDLSAMVGRSRAVADRMSAGVEFLMRKNKIDVIWGEARLAQAGVVEVRAAPNSTRARPPPKGARGAGAYRAAHVILATGARPRVLPGLEPDGERVWSYFEALAPPAIPRSLVIVGSGAIGVEFASFYSALGAGVTLVETLPRILPAEDAEIAGLARKAFEQDGVRILTSTRVARLEREGAGLRVHLEGEGARGAAIEAERLISAVGVAANVENLGLEALGVTMAGGAIATDGLGRTSVAGLHAIGDVAGGPMLAHKAEHEAVICVEAIAGLKPHALDRSTIPACVYSHPQIASVGLTGEAARAAGHAVRVGRFPFAANGKAVALGEEGGLVKTILEAGSGRLLGAHMIGAEVTELIHGFVLAMNLETTEEELIASVFPHPTLSEAMRESALAAFGRPINA